MPRTKPPLPAIYKRFNILPQDEEGMQKPVGPVFGDRQEAPGGVQDADPAARPLPGHRGGEVRRREGVPVGGPARPLLGQSHGGHVPQQGVEAHEPASDRRPRGLDGARRQGVGDPEPPGACPA